MTDQSKLGTPSAQPAKPENASEAAAQLLRWLPRVKSPENEQFFHGFYKDGKPVFINDSLDRSVALGTLHGIAEGRVPTYLPATPYLYRTF